MKYEQSELSNKDKGTIIKPNFGRKIISETRFKEVPIIKANELYCVLFFIEGPSPTIWSNIDWIINEKLSRGM